MPARTSFSEARFALNIPWFTPLGKVPLVMMDCRYAERYIRISRGRLPRFFVDFLLNLRGFDSANVRPRYSPATFQLDFLRKGIIERS